MLDLTESIAPRSDQMNSDDLVSGPRTFTIAEVRQGNSAEQPFDFVLAEFPQGRPFKPSKTVRRILVMLWGKDASAYVGRRFTLYRDPNVRFGGQQVGGIRISHMSHIDKSQKLSLTETRGKKAIHIIEPLPDSAPTSPPVDEGTVARLAELRAEWKDADADRKKAIEAEVAELSAAQDAASEGS
jgi:hypothetical protein